jgi:hypothetical protein
VIDTWINVIFPSEKKTPYGQIATDPDPGMSNSTRYYQEGGVLRSHALAAQAAFDQALVLAMSGEAVRVVSEAQWRRVANQATEPMRKAKVRAESARRRELAAALKAERNGHVPAEATDEDHAAAEEELALALADTHEPAGDEEQAR